MGLKSALRNWLLDRPGELDVAMREISELRQVLDSFFAVNNLMGRFTTEGWSAQEADRKEADLSKRITAQVLAECRKEFSPKPPSPPEQAG